MHSNTLATLLRKYLSLVELLSNLSDWRMLCGSFLVDRGGGGSEVSLRSWVMSYCLCRLIEAVPKGTKDSFWFLFEDLILLTVAITISTTALSLATRS